MSDSDTDRSEGFRRERQRQRDHLFGLYLYHTTRPRAFRWMQRGAYRRTVSRVQKALAAGDELLAAVEADVPAAALALFEWPPWTQESEDRIRTMLEVYAAESPSRPKTELDIEDVARLSQAVLKYL